MDAVIVKSEQAYLLGSREKQRDSKLLCSEMGVLHLLARDVGETLQVASRIDLNEKHISGKRLNTLCKISKRKRKLIIVYNYLGLQVFFKIVKRSVA